MALLTFRAVSLAFGGPRLLDGVDWQIERGERICLLGRNGEGKSTMLRLLAGELAPDEGDIVRAQGLRVARLVQEVPDGHGGSVADEVAEGLPDDPDGHRPDGSDYRVQAVLSRVGLDPDRRFSDLSSGMKRRVLLARALVAEPDVLLLDEPTNHLDVDAIQWLEEFLLRYDGTLVFVTHDRAFLGRLATRIVELDRGRLYDWACNYATFLQRRDELWSAEARQNALFDKKLAQEEVWIRKGIEARRTRNEGRVRALKAMREAHQQRRDRQGTARLQMQEAEKSGMLVVEAKNVDFGYESRPILQGLETQIMRGDKVGVIGPNGAGKSTLLKLLLGELEPSSGSIRRGTNLQIAYFDQLRDTLDDEKTVQQNVSEYETVTIDGRSRHIIGYLQDFLFSPERARTLVRYLSGGERGRLLLARLLTKPSNVLVLDEPTNDLDLETLDLLGDLLVNYQGTVLLVSHDRAFLNDVATSTLVIGPDGRVKEYEGGYDDYWGQSRAVEAAAEPKPAGPRPRGESAPEKSRKRSFKESRELEALPAQIEAMESESRQIHEAMADPAFYKKPASEMAEAKARLQALETELATAYARWEELESLPG